MIRRYYANIHYGRIYSKSLQRTYITVSTNDANSKRVNTILGLFHIISLSYVDFISALNTMGKQRFVEIQKNKTKKPQQSLDMMNKDEYRKHFHEWEKQQLS